MSGGVEERAQEWERRYEEGLQQKKLKAAATSSSSSSSLSSSSSAAAQTSSNTSSVPMQQVSWGAIGGPLPLPLPLPLPGRDSGTDRAAETWRSYSSRRAAAHDPDLHAPGAKRMRRLERLAGRFMPLMMDPGKSHSRPAAAAVPASSSLGALGDGTSRSVHSHRHDTAVVDLTSSFVEDLPDDLAFLSDAFPSDTPTPTPTHSHSRRSQGIGSGRAIPAADCCYLAVYVSEIPAFRTLSVPLNCDHCKQSLRAAPSPPSASSSSSSSSMSGRSSSDVVIGIVSAAPAPSSVVRSQQAWLALWFVLYAVHCCTHLIDLVLVLVFVLLLQWAVGAPDLPSRGQQGQGSPGRGARVLWEPQVHGVAELCRPPGSRQDDADCVDEHWTMAVLCSLHMLDTTHPFLLTHFQYFEHVHHFSLRQLIFEIKQYSIVRIQGIQSAIWVSSAETLSGTP